MSGKFINANGAYISESPFSVTINIKKSFITNKNGDSLNGALDPYEVKAFELPEVKIENKSVTNIKTKASEDKTIKPSNPTQPLTDSTSKPPSTTSSSLSRFQSDKTFFSFEQSPNLTTKPLAPSNNNSMCTMDTLKDMDTLSTKINGNSTPRTPPGLPPPKQFLCSSPRPISTTVSRGSFAPAFPCPRTPPIHSPRITPVFLSPRPPGISSPRTPPGFSSPQPTQCSTVTSGFCSESYPFGKFPKADLGYSEDEFSEDENFAETLKKLIIKYDIK